MDYSMQGFPVLHHLSEFTQTNVHWVFDAIQTFHFLSLPSSQTALNLSQNQGLFQWVSSSHQVARVLEPQHQSFQWILRVGFLSYYLVWSPCCPKDSQESSRTTNKKPEFLVVQTSLRSNSMFQPYMTTGKNIALAIQSFVMEVLFLLLTRCLGFSLLLFQEVSIFKFHRCSHGLQWLWSPRK